MDTELDIDTQMKVEVINREDKAEHMIVKNCDHSIVVVIADVLMKEPGVAFAAANEVHPLKEETNLIVRLEDGCETDFDAMFNNATLSLTRKVLDLQARAITGVDGRELVDECEMPDGGLVKARLVLYDSDYKWANVVRRIMMNKIRALAITNVTFRRNISAFPDEILAHRISMIPVRYKNGVVPKHNQGGVSFSLQVFIPEDAPSSVTRISSSQMEVTVPDVTLAFSSKESDGFTIAKLAPKQCLDLVCAASVGQGMSHARFSVVTSVGFKKVDNDYHLTVEMAGQMKPSVVVDAAMQTLAEILNSLRTSFSLRSKP